MTQKLLNLAEELVKYWKLLSDKYLFADGRFYSMALQISGNNINSVELTQVLV
jgi:hypothetical protein